MENKKIPMRKCLITNQMFPKSELIRVVYNKENGILIDDSAKQKVNGRGAYLRLTKDNVEQAKKRRVFEREFKQDDLIDIYNQLLGLCNE